MREAGLTHQVGEWLEKHIDELNQIYVDHRAPVTLILSCLHSRAGLTKDQFLTIVQQKGISKMKYEAGSVAEQSVAEGKAETKREVALRLIPVDMNDAEISEIIDLPLETLAWRFGQNNWHFTER